MTTTARTVRRTTTAKKAAASKVAASKTKAATPAVARVATVPDIATHDLYVDRYWSGGHTTYDLYETGYRNGFNILNEGPTQCGKTTSAEAWAAFKGLAYYAIPNNAGISNDDLFGKYVPDETGSAVAVWQDGPVTDIFRHGGVLVANELPFLPDRVQSILYQALGRERQVSLQAHKAEVIRAHLGSEGPKPCWCNGSDPDCDDKRVLIIADMNPGYQGVRDLNDAVRARFLIQNTWDYDPAVEAQLVRSSSLQAVVAQLRAEAAKGTYDTPISTGMMIEFETLAVTLSMPFAVTNFVNHFRTDERASVALVLDTWSSQLESEIEVAYATPTKGRKRTAAKKSDPDYDPEWGIHGVGWVFEDEDA